MRSVLHQSVLTLVVTVIISALTAIVLAPVASHGPLMLWIAAVVLVSGTRWIIRNRILKTDLEAWHSRRLAAFSIIGSLASGSLWGIAASVLFPVPQTYQLFLAFAVAGLCAGTTAVNSSHMPTVIAFILPASLPLAARFMAEGTTPWIVAGLMILVFAAALSVTSLRVHRSFAKRIRLQLTLTLQGRALIDANEQLRREVAERLKAEATLLQAQKMEAIGHLTGGIAHDFNNLLQVISGNLDAIARHAAGNSRIINSVRAAEEAASQGSRLTASLLAFGRRQSLQKERVNLNTLLREFEPILLRAIDKTIRLQMSLAPDLPDCEADPAHFKSAVLNIVINARDAMPQGGNLSITSATATLDEDDLLTNPDARSGRFASVSFQDTGSGMTAEVMTRVYEPFFTTKEVGKGSGLGLSQVYGFVRQSGGHIQLRSTPGAGTCITLLLPIAAA